MSDGILPLGSSNLDGGNLEQTSASGGATSGDPAASGISPVHLELPRSTLGSAPQTETPNRG